MPLAAPALRLRAATLEDAPLLFEWRNDPLTREASVNEAPVEWDQHLSWLRASLETGDRELLIAEADGEPVGVVRIDHGEETELSWTVAPSARGRGLGKAMVRMALPSGPVIATIKRENRASQRIAQAVGLHLTRDAALQRWEAGGSRG